MNQDGALLERVVGREQREGKQEPENGDERVFNARRFPNPAAAAVIHLGNQVAKRHRQQQRHRISQGEPENVEQVAPHSSKERNSCQTAHQNFCERDCTAGCYVDTAQHKTYAKGVTRKERL